MYVKSALKGHAGRPALTGLPQATAVLITGERGERDAHTPRQIGLNVYVDLAYARTLVAGLRLSLDEAEHLSRELASAVKVVRADEEIGRTAVGRATRIE